MPARNEQQQPYPWQTEEAQTLRKHGVHKNTQVPLPEDYHRAAVWLAEMGHIRSKRSDISRAYQRRIDKLVETLTGGPVRPKEEREYPEEVPGF
jgi:hypothetical protein